MQVIEFIIYNDNFYSRKSEHYGANKTASIVFSLKFLC